MKKIDLGLTISILANVGVIAGIVFLALELQQNTSLLAAQARWEQLDARTAAGSVELNNSDVARLIYKVQSGEDLTPYEYSRFVTFAIYLFTNWEWQYDEYQAGILAGDDLPVAGWTIRAQTLPQLRQVWEETKSNRSPSFIQFVEENVFNR